MNLRAPILSRRATMVGSARAFTLIEVIVTLTIFILLTASVFGIMTAVFQSSNGLQANQNRRDEVSAFRAFLKNNFDNLAADDHLISYRRGNGEGLLVNGIILVTRGNTFALDAYPQPNGLYGLRLGRPAPDQNPNPDLATFAQQLDRNQNALAWSPLIRDVHLVSWRFQGDAAADWQNEWLADPKKPTLVECSLELAGDDLPSSMDFLLPRLVPSTSANPAPVATPAATVNAP